MSKKLHEISVVSFVEGDYAYLKTDSTSSCNSCSSKSACGSGKLLSFTDSNPTIRVPNTLNLKQGDEVIIGMSSDKLLLGTILVYLLPLLFLFLFAAIAKMFGGELQSVLAGFGGLLLGLVFAKKITSINSIAKQFQPKVEEKIQKTAFNL